ncbi:MAG TPA: NUDIX domain-containing protein [Candidatus Brachybacterium merdigallinarum]|nr:NUDIX domain-containing protein [Candidatus Brachybacterium merdigallinarum]
MSRVLGAVLTAGHRLRRLWWRVRRPRTFGVKVLLHPPEDPMRFLAVRHSYVDRDRWALPGGRYRPRRECPAEAGRREVASELSLTITGDLPEVTALETVTEGKRDRLTIHVGTAASREVSTSLELSEARWLRTDLADVPDGAPLSRWLRIALSPPDPSPAPSSRPDSAPQ